MSLSFSLQVSFSLCLSVLSVSLFLYALRLPISHNDGLPRRAIASLALFKIALAHPTRSPHWPFKIASPEPLQSLSCGYKWVGFVKLDLGCGWVLAALSGFMVVGMSWLGWLWLMGVGWLIWWLVVVGCVMGWGCVVGGFFSFLFYFFNAIECHG